MKKIVALLLVLGLLCVCFAACAEQITADGSPVKLDGLTLNLAAGEKYKLPTGQSSACITVTPFAGKGNLSTNYNVSVVLPGVSLTVEGFRKDTSSYKTKMESGLKENGYNVKEFNMPGVKDIEILGQEYPALEYDMILDFGTGDTHIYMRQVFITDKDRAITITAYSVEEMEQIGEMISAELVWDD
jgi:hypothetical protein